MGLFRIKLLCFEFLQNVLKWGCWDVSEEQRCLHAPSD